MRQETVWNSQYLAQLGAAFTFERQEHPDVLPLKTRGQTPGKLGVRLAEEFDGKDGSKAPGWEKDMVWFTRD